MTDSIPDYYRHLAEQRKSAEEEQKPSAPAQDGSPEERAAGPVPYRADAFRMQLPSEEWTDRSLYTLTGPTVDGIQHNITINVEREPEADDLAAFAEEQIESLEAALDNCRVLMVDPVELTCGLPAHRAIYTWQPNDDLQLYQEQIYVMDDGDGFVLTSSFTRKTRKQLGAAVENMMLSFTPRNHPTSAEAS